MYNQHARGMATARHRSLVEKGGRKALLETLHTQKKKCQKSPIFTNLKEKMRAHRASSKAFVGNRISYEVIKAISIKKEVGQITKPAHLMKETY